jgi:hypothetical protein
MSDAIFVEGLFYNPPRENAPDFVKGQLSIDPKRFVEFLRTQTAHINEKGYIKLDILLSKDGAKHYAVVNTWKPEDKSSVIPF